MKFVCGETVNSDWHTTQCVHGMECMFEAQLGKAFAAAVRCMWGCVLAAALCATAAWWPQARRPTCEIVCTAQYPQQLQVATRPVLLQLTASAAVWACGVWCTRAVHFCKTGLQFLWDRVPQCLYL